MSQTGEQQRRKGCLSEPVLHSLTIQCTRERQMQLCSSQALKRKQAGRRAQTGWVQKFIPTMHDEVQFDEVQFATV